MRYLNLFLSAGIVVALTVVSVTSHAQRNVDVKSVDIVSAYRPQIMKSVKFQFLPNLPLGDSSRIQPSYALDVSNYFPNYQLSPLRPLALPLKTDPLFADRFYAKLGYGNLKSPYAHLFYTKRQGLTKGVSLHALHQSATGKLPLQKFSQSSFSMEGFKQFVPRNVVVRGGLQYNLNQVYRYGVRDVLSLPVPKADHFQYSNILIRAGLNTVEPSQYGITFGSDVEAGFFYNQKGDQEKVIKLSVPLQKQLDENWALSLVGNAQIASINHSIGHTISNNLFSTRLLVSHSSRSFTIQGGLHPIWDNTGFTLLPILNGTVNVDSTKLVVQWGWEGTNLVNSYQQLVGLNNWIEAPSAILNTRTTEFYAGIKGATNLHLTYQLRGGWALINNCPLFLNDTSSLTKGNSFFVLFEPQLQRLQLLGEVGYQVANRIGVRATATISKFSGLKQQARPWGILPVEFKLSSRIEVRKDLYIDLTAFSWQGASFLQRDGKVNRSKGAFDFSTNLEFKLNSSWRLWGQFNNLFNQSYQRWNQYPVYGFNFLAGVVFSPQLKRPN